MDLLNFKGFLEADENDPNKDKGDPLTSLTTVVGIPPEMVPASLAGGHYILNKVLNGKQYSAVVGNIEPKLVKQKFVGSKIKIDPSILPQKTTTAYIKNSINRNASVPEKGWVNTNTTDDLIMLGFPAQAGGGAGPAPGIS